MSRFVYTKHEQNLRAAGIPWRTPRAVSRCALKLDSALACHAAALYLQELAREETYPQARQACYAASLFLHRRYHAHASESGKRGIYYGYAG